MRWGAAVRGAGPAEPCAACANSAFQEQILCSSRAVAQGGMVQQLCWNRAAPAFRCWHFAWEPRKTLLWHLRKDEGLEPTSRRPFPFRVTSQHRNIPQSFLCALAVPCSGTSMFCLAPRASRVLGMAFPPWKHLRAPNPFPACITAFPESLCF